MKTPREILLSRHSQAEPKLDDLRQEVMKGVVAAKEDREFTFAATVFLASVVRELIWRPRRIWAGLAAVWIVILAVNFHLDAGTPLLAAGSSPNSSGYILTLREQERVIAELTGNPAVPAATTTRRHEQPPRSEATSNSAMI